MTDPATPPPTPVLGDPVDPDGDIDVVDDVGQLILWAATLIATVDGGSPTSQSAGWREGATAWTIAYHDYLDAQQVPSGGPQ